MRQSLTAVAVAFGSMAGSLAASQIQEFGVATPHSTPSGIAAGSDGALWFTENSADRIGRITTSGTVTEFALAAGSAPLNIALGADGAMWFTESTGNKIGRITPAGTIAEFPLPTAGSSPRDIALGSDGNMWFTEFANNSNPVGSITVDGHITEITNQPEDFLEDCGGIAAGPDGDLWVKSDISTWPVCQISTSREANSFLDFSGDDFVGSGYIAAGPDEALWFTVAGGNSGEIGRCSTGGQYEAFPINSSSPQRIALGPDGSLWFAEMDLGAIGRITTGGSYTEISIPTTGSNPFGVCLGPDGSIWFTEAGANKIGQISFSAPPGPRAGVVPPSGIVVTDVSGRTP